MILAILRFIFKISGWTLKPELPKEVHRCVMLAAPHTSNWDFIYARAAFDMYKVPVRFTVKKEFNIFPFNIILNALGAIWIDRSPKKPGEKRPSMVQVMTDIFKTHEEMSVMVTPEGTRSLRTKWKTGFYHVAKNAGVPICLGYVDFAKKEAGVGKVIYPSGDYEADMREIVAFYKTKGPCHPEKFSPDLDFDTKEGGLTNAS